MHKRLNTGRPASGKFPVPCASFPWLRWLPPVGMACPARLAAAPRKTRRKMGVR